MKEGQTVFVIYRTMGAIEGVLGSETTAQGFYTRWGPGHYIYLRTAGIQAKEVAYNDENIFSTKEAAKKELFSRRLRFPQLRGAA
jgi:hypothetical protein